MKILVLTTILPRQKLMGSEVASQCFIDALTQNGHQVSVVGYMRKDKPFEINPQSEILVDKRYIETKKAKSYPILWLGFSLLNKLPYSAAKYYTNTYINTVNKLLATQNYEVVIIDHSQLGWLEPLITAKDRLITLVHNIEQEIYLQSFKGAKNLLSKWIYQREASLIKEMEDKLASRAREVWTLTQHDAEYFSKFNKLGKVRVFDLAPGSGKLPDKPSSKNFDIGIIGSWAWKANKEGLEWFLEKVYPHLPANLSIHIAGNGADWLTQKYSNIQYRGFVPDAQEFMAQAKVVAIPILSGGGIQIKTLDAIASGSAIVATPVGMRGISHPPKTVQIAQQTKDFANLLIAAIASPSSQQAFDDSLTWYRARRDKFVADVERGISEL
jgi:glycosyltransferase involved in cell wall biosynthesis